MLKVLSSILCDLDPKVKVIGQKAGICDGVPSTSALVLFIFMKAKRSCCCCLHVQFDHPSMAKIQNNFTEWFLITPSTKIAQMVPLR